MSDRSPSTTQVVRGASEYTGGESRPRWSTLYTRGRVTFRFKCSVIRLPNQYLEALGLSRREFVPKFPTW